MYMCMEMDWLVTSSLGDSGVGTSGWSIAASPSPAWDLCALWFVSAFFNLVQGITYSPGVCRVGGFVMFEVPPLSIESLLVRS
jgi:hypothetical protein